LGYTKRGKNKDKKYNKLMQTVFDENALSPKKGMAATIKKTQNKNVKHFTKRLK
jgi:hypothetical protein